MQLIKIHFIPRKCSAWSPGLVVLELWLFLEIFITRFILIENKMTTTTEEADDVTTAIDSNDSSRKEKEEPVMLRAAQIRIKQVCSGNEKKKVRGSGTRYSVVQKYTNFGRFQLKLSNFESVLRYYWLWNLVGF